jgi:GT2 family glycosyltransferase
LELAKGEYVVLLDNDDELASNALYENAKLINTYPDADWIYSDENKIDEKNNHFNYDFKPDWSPELLRAYMYTCHLSVYRTSLVRSIGGFRSAFDGAQDYDLALRMMDVTPNIYHIPKVLYHWRTIAGSTALNPNAKKHAYEAGRKALEESLQINYSGVNVEMTDAFGVYKVTGIISEYPTVSIIIPSAGKSVLLRGKQTCLLENCVQSILERSSYPNLEIVVVDGKDIQEDVRTRLIQRGVKWVSCERPFNFSERINAGVKASTGSFVLLLNDDTEVVNSDWVEQMMWFAQQEDVGSVGVKLVTEQHKIQHIGIVLYEGSPEHICYGQPDVGQGYLNTFVANRNYLAVTAACLLVSREKYDQVNGLDESFPVNYNDVDFCLKLHERGYRNVLVAQTKLYHYESISRTIGYKSRELEQFLRKWEHYPAAQNDPYYNPNLSANPVFLF